MKTRKSLPHDKGGRVVTELFHSLVWAVFPALVILGALYDATSFTIPNWVSLAMAGLYAPAALLMGVPLPVIGLCYLLGFIVLLATMGMFAMNWIGGGDAKLLAAAVIWFGLPHVIDFVLATTLAGGALAVLLTTMRSSPLAVQAGKSRAWVSQLLAHNGPAPYGVAIAVGGLFAFPSAPIVTAALHAS
jgi:prepilin peptidase CpaA